MGKNIDLSKITDDDVEYLLQRPWLAAQAEHEGHAVPEQFYIASGKTVPQYIGLTDSAESEEVVTGDPLEEDPEEDPEDESEEDDRTYQEWSVDELKAELVQRDLSKEGRKQELIDRLEADDLEDEEDDEDDTEG